MATYPVVGSAPWTTTLQAYIDAGDAQDGVSLGPSNGTDDTATINGLLTTYAGYQLLGVRGQNYKISSPLILRSSTALDLTGCTLTLNSGSNSGMVRNYSWMNPAATAADAAITAGNNVVTTSLGASAVVGQSVTIAGAGASVIGTPAASGVLTGIVSAKTSTTITLANLTNEALNAGITVSGAAISLFNRDHDISFICDNVVRGSNGGVNQDLHSVAFRGVDRCSVIVRGGSSSGGKYMTRFSDCRDFYADIVGVNWNSDVCHINGPCTNGFIQRVTGQHNDDLFAITTNDYTNDSDTSGEVRDITIGYLRSDGGLTHSVLIASGPLGIVSDIKVLDGIYGHSANGVLIGGYAATDMGTYNNIDLGNIHPDNTQTVFPLNIGTGTFDKITAKINHFPQSGSTREAVSLGFAGTAGTTTIRECEFDITIGVNAPAAVRCPNSSVTVEHLVLNRPVAIGQIQSGANLVSLTAGTIKRLSIIRPNYQPDVSLLTSMVKVGTAVDEILIDEPYAVVTAGCFIVELASSGSNKLTTFRDGSYIYSSLAGGNLFRGTAGTVGKVVFKGGYVSKGASLYQDAAGLGGSPLVAIEGTVQNGGSRSVVFQSGTASAASFVDLSVTSMSNPLFHANATTMIVEGNRINGLSTALVSRNAGTEVVKVKGPFLPVDVALLTPDDGDICINNNTASGPLVAQQVTWDATNSKWRPTRGFVASGTATLVAGTVTVSDAKITANSVIRYATRTVGGTQGAIFTSALTAATSFTIKSTSSTDTSVVYYEITSYV